VTLGRLGEDDECGFELRIGQHLQRLFSVYCNVDFYFETCLRKNLLDQSDIAGIIVDQKDLFHEDR
jgi:hypothetical protein